MILFTLISCLKVQPKRRLNNDKPSGIKRPCHWVTVHKTGFEKQIIWRPPDKGGCKKGHAPFRYMPLCFVGGQCGACLLLNQEKPAAPCGFSQVRLHLLRKQPSCFASIYLYPHAVDCCAISGADRASFCTFAVRSSRPLPAHSPSRDPYKKL